MFGTKILAKARHETNFVYYYNVFGRQRIIESALGKSASRVFCTSASSILILLTVGK
jgi:hypothetical protein